MTSTMTSVVQRQSAPRCRTWAIILCRRSAASTLSVNASRRAGGPRLPTKRKPSHMCLCRCHAVARHAAPQYTASAHSGHGAAQLARSTRAKQLPQHAVDGGDPPAARPATKTCSLYRHSSTSNAAQVNSPLPLPGVNVTRTGALSMRGSKKESRRRASRLTLVADGEEVGCVVDIPTAAGCLPQACLWPSRHALSW